MYELKIERACRLASSLSYTWVKIYIKKPQVLVVLRFLKGGFPNERGSLGNK